MFSLLLVDDDPDDILLVETALDELNTPVAVETLRNGEQALKRLRGQPTPDLVLMDMNMPRLSGLEVLLELRHTVRDLKVVLWSSGWQPQHESKVLASGAQAYLHKPTSYSDLVTLLRSLIQGVV